MKSKNTKQNLVDTRFQVTQAHLFLFLILAVVLFGVFRILRPYLNTIILAIITGALFYPIHRRFLTWTGNRPNTAALISCVALVLVVLIPLSLVTTALIHQGILSFQAIQDWLNSGNLEKMLESEPAMKIKDIVSELVPDFHFADVALNDNLVSSSAGVGKFLLDQGKGLLGNITATIAKFFLMVFVFFFIVRDGERLLDLLLHLIPLSASQEKEIIEKIRAVSRSAILGTVITALAQGLAGGIALTIAGLPGFFWGTVMAFASLIPLVGTALIWVPAAGYLALSGHWGMGIFVAVWCAVVVGSIDNFLRPYFMKGPAGMSPLLIFFAIIGGIQLFGLIGIIYGPLIFGLAIVLLYIYELEFREYLEHQDRA